MAHLPSGVVRQLGGLAVAEERDAGALSVGFDADLQRGDHRSEPGPERDGIGTTASYDLRLLLARQTDEPLLGLIHDCLIGDPGRGGVLPPSFDNQVLGFDAHVQTLRESPQWLDHERGAPTGVGAARSYDSIGCVSRARALWQYGEPVNAIVYYAPEVRAATDALGLRGGWMSYFGCRAAPLGAVTAPVVTTLFYNFHPQMVARAIPDAWSYAPPSALLEARVMAMDRAMRRVLGDAEVSSSSVSRAATLASEAVARCDMAGQPMGAANQAVPEPDEPHLRLWQALTSIREHRGDGHVNRLVNAGISPPEALVLQAVTGRSPEEGLRSNRGWSADEWSMAAESLAARGLLDHDMNITAKGNDLRQAVEEDTDRLAAPIAEALSDDGADELVALLDPLAKRVMASGAVPAHNNMGFPWPPGDG